MNDAIKKINDMTEQICRLVVEHRASYGNRDKEMEIERKLKSLISKRSSAKRRMIKSAQVNLL